MRPGVPVGYGRDGRVVQVGGPRAGTVRGGAVGSAIGSAAGLDRGGLGDEGDDAPRCPTAGTDERQGCEPVYQPPGPQVARQADAALKNMLKHLKPQVARRADAAPIPNAGDGDQADTVTCLQPGHRRSQYLVVIAIHQPFGIPPNRIGRRRTGWLVAANTAFATAGAMGDVPGSPTPPGGAVLGTMYTSTTGISSSRNRG